MKTNEIYTKNIFTSIQMLGDFSGRSYVILDTEQNYFAIQHCNDAYLNLIEHSAGQIIGQSFFKILLNFPTDLNINDMINQLSRGQMVTLEGHHKRGASQTFNVELQCLPFQNEDGEPLFILVFVKDVSYTKVEQLITKVEKQLFHAIEQGRLLEEKLQLICNEVDSFYKFSTFSAIMLKTNDDELLAVHSSLHDSVSTTSNFLKYKLTHAYQEAMLLTTPTTISVQESTDLIAKHRQYALENGLDTCILFPITNQNKTVIGLYSAYFTFNKDIDSYNFTLLQDKISSLISLAYTYAISQQRIYELSHKDIATGLANRTLFVNTLKKIIQSGKSGYVKILEPGEFANVVELYGRQLGDELLHQIAERFKKLHDMEDVYMARFSSSALVLYRIMPKNELEHIEFDQRIRELLHEPYLLGDKKVYITLKTGIARFDIETKITDVIRNTENALSYARKKTGTYTAMFTEERSKELERQMMIVNHLNLALQRDEFSVHLQPKVNLKTNEISSLEALIRWHSPELGYVSPVDFLPAAESIGKIREIDHFVIKQVLAFMQQRQQLEKNPYRVAVNISPEHFYYESFVEDLYQLVTTYHVPPQHIIIEITETTGLVDLQKALEIMNDLKSRGFTISVDDFGVGYSSLSYLQKLPFSELKIDRSFSIKIHEAGTEAVVRSIIQLAQYFEMDVVAEGIETEEQKQKLTALGCKIGQGYLFYKPMPLEEINQYL